jgi:hypothetical protein
MVGRYADLIEAHRDAMTMPLVNQVEAALRLSVREIAAAERLRGEYWHRVRKVLKTFDYIVAPSVGIAASSLESRCRRRSPASRSNASTMCSSAPMRSHHGPARGQYPPAAAPTMSSRRDPGRGAACAG